MNIENIFQNSNIENTASFFSSVISLMDIDDFNLDDDIKSKINNNINEKIQLGPNSYLDSVCVEVAEDLLNKNIFVISSLRFHNYMYLLLDKLSKENRKILKNKYKENKINYFINFERTEYYGIRVDNCNNKNNEEISKEFLDFASDFQIQDIQRGYFNEKTFLMNVFGCEKVEGIKEYKNSDINTIFDVNKMDKSFKEYLKDSGYEQYYLQEEHRIYLNDFFLNAHKKYLDFKSTILS